MAGALTEVRYYGTWLKTTRIGKRLFVYPKGKTKEIKVTKGGKVGVVVPRHVESVRRKPTPKPVRKPRRKPYSAVGRRRRRRWRRRLRRRRRRRRRRYNRRLKRPILRFKFHRRWMTIVKWRGEYRMKYRGRWISFR